MYAYVIAALALFGAGFSLSHQLDKAELVALQNAVSSANAQAQAIQDASAAELARVKNQQAAINKELEVSHAQSINTINVYRDQLSAIRLPTTSCAGNKNRMPGSNRAGSAENQTSNERFSETFDRLVKTESERADRVAEYAQLCYRFVVEQNCGMPRQINGR